MYLQFLCLHSWLEPSSSHRKALPHLLCAQCTAPSQSKPVALRPWSVLECVNYGRQTKKSLKVEVHSFMPPIAAMAMNHHTQIRRCLLETFCQLNCTVMNITDFFQLLASPAWSKQDLYFGIRLPFFCRLNLGRFHNLSCYHSEACLQVLFPLLL